MHSLTFQNENCIDVIISTSNYYSNYIITNYNMHNAMIALCILLQSMNQLVSVGDSEQDSVTTDKFTTKLIILTAALV